MVQWESLRKGVSFAGVGVGEMAESRLGLRRRPRPRAARPAVELDALEKMPRRRNRALVAAPEGARRGVGSRGHLRLAVAAMVGHRRGVSMPSGPQMSTTQPLPGRSTSATRTVSAGRSGAEMVRSEPALARLSFHASTRTLRVRCASWNRPPYVARCWAVSEPTEIAVRAMPSKSHEHPSPKWASAVRSDCRKARWKLMRELRVQR